MGATSRAFVRLISVCSLFGGLLAACADDQPTFVDAGAIDAPPGDPPPGPVTNLRTTNTPSGLEIDWNPPDDTDLAGVLIVVGEGVPVTFAPTDGMTYTGSVGTGQTARAMAPLADYGYEGIAGVEIQFAVWAFDTAGQFSVIATTDGRTDQLGIQLGEIQLFQNGTVLVTQQPPHLRLSGTVVYDGKGGTMVADLEVRNQTGRILFNLKGLIDSTSQGAATNQLFPSVGGRPMIYYGPAGQRPGSSRTEQLSLTGIDGSMDPVVVHLDFVDAPSIVLQGADNIAKGGGNERGLSILDSAGSGRISTISLPPQDCGRAEPRGAAMTADASAVFTGNKSIPRVSRFDLTTLELTLSAELTTSDGIGAVSDVALSADGTRLYALLHDGSHFGGRAATGAGCNKNPDPDPVPEAHPTGVIFGGPAPAVGVATLVELDAETLVENRRVALVAAPRRTKLGIAGNRAVVLNTEGNLAHIVDLTTFTEVDTDAILPDIQPLPLGATHFQSFAAAPNGSSFSVALQGADSGYDIVTFDTASLTSTRQNSAPGEFARVVGMWRGADGHVLVLSATSTKGPAGAELEELDGTTVTPRFSTRGAMAQGLVVTPKRFYIANDLPGVQVVDRGTMMEVDTNADDTDGITPLRLDDESKPHGTAVSTPF